MKAICSFIILAIFLACGNPKKDVAPGYSFRFPDSILQAKIKDTLRKLPFIIKRQTYFDSVSNHKEGVTFTMDTFKNKIYPTAVYLNEDNHFEKLFRFEVDPQTMKIKINDINTGEFISLEEYYKLAPEDKN